MSQSMRRMGTIVGAVVVCGAVVWMAAPAMALPAGSVANVIVNGDFESGPDWGGLNNPPQGWEQLLGGRQRLMHRSRAPMQSAAAGVQCISTRSKQSLLKDT